MWHALIENWTLALGVVVLIALLAVVAILSKYVRLMLNILRDTPPPLLMGPFDFTRVEGRHVQFRAFDGTRLRGMFLTPDSLPDDLEPSLPAQAAPVARSRAATKLPPEMCHRLTPDLRGVIIFCHEYGSDMYSCLRYCQPLLEAGYAIFTFDFRGHGQSGRLPGYEARLWCTDKEVSDCLGALALVRQELHERNLDLNIGLFGISRGAGAAIMTAQEAQRRSPIQAVLADSAFSTDITIEWSMKRWVHIFARVRLLYNNHHPQYYRFIRWLLLICARKRFKCRFPSVRKAVAKLHTPLFFIHGKKDSYIQPEHTQRLFALAQPPRHLWIVPKAKHNQSAIVEPQRYAGRTVAFFDKYLTDTPPATDGRPLPLHEEVIDFFVSTSNACRPQSKTEDANHDQPRDRICCRPPRRQDSPRFSGESDPLCRPAREPAATDSPEQ